MAKNETNTVHLHGFVNNVTEVSVKDTTKFILDMVTQEAWKDNTGEYQKKNTYHDVILYTNDEKTISSLRAIADDISNNEEHRGEENFKPQVHKASVDGKLLTRVNSKDGVDYYNTFILTNDQSIAFDTELGKEEKRNIAEFQGNIASVTFDNDDRFAIVRLATHYYAPGEGVNYKGETKAYHEETAYIETRLSANFRKDTFKNLKEGQIDKGDLVKVRGVMHNNSYTDKEGIKRYKIVVDVNKIDIVAKKGEKKTQEAKAEPQKETAKEAKAESKKTAVKSAVKKAKPRTMTR